MHVINSILKQGLLLGNLKLGLISGILLMNFNIAFCQDDSVWFEKGAKWYYSYIENAHSPYRGYFQLEVVGDTVIMDSTYQIVQSLLVHSDGDSVYLDDEYFRYSNHLDKVFHYFDGQDNLLYDFSAEATDTILIPFQLWSGTVTIKMVVDSVGIEEFPEQVIRRVQYASVLEPIEYIFGGKVIEGIGSEGFFLPGNSLDCDDGCAGPIRCYSDSEMNVRFLSSLECTSLLNNIEFDSYFDFVIRVFPNPADSNIFIESDLLISSVSVYDINGDLIYQRSGDMLTRINFDVSTFTPGLYLVSITYIDGTNISQKLIIE